MFDEEADANEEGAVDANEEGAVDEEADADPGLELDDWLPGGCDGSEEDRVDDQELMAEVKEAARCIMETVRYALLCSRDLEIARYAPLYDRDS